MKAIVQRVTSASVTVDKRVVGEVSSGLCVLVGVTHSDTAQTARKLAARLAKLRIFADDGQKMNRSVLDVGGEVLVVSQFTLYADTSKGARPSFGAAAPSGQAEPLVDLVASELGAMGLKVETGEFGAMMQVQLVNDGPVTVTVDVSD